MTPTEWPTDSASAPPRPPFPRLKLESLGTATGQLERVARIMADPRYRRSSPACQNNRVGGPGSSNRSQSQ